MVVLAQSPSGQCAQSSSQAKIATVMLGVDDRIPVRFSAVIIDTERSPS
jgi:hypothetical protein